MYAKLLDIKGKIHSTMIKIVDDQIKDNLINRGAEQTGWIYVKG